MSEGCGWIEGALIASGQPVNRTTGFSDQGSEGRREDQAPPSLLAEQARAATWLGVLTAYLSGPVAARPILEQAAALCLLAGDQRNRAYALGHLAWAAASVGESPIAAAVGNEALQVGRQVGDPWLMGLALHFLSFVPDQIPRQLLLAEEALTWLRRAGNPATIANNLNRLGGLYILHGDFDLARLHHEESLSLTESTRVIHRSEALQGLGELAIAQNDTARATLFFRECLTLNREIGRPPYLLQAVMGLGRVALVTGRRERAARLFGAVDALMSHHGWPFFWLVRRESFHAAVIGTRSGLGDAAFAAEWQAGRLLSLDGLIAEALADCDSDKAAPPRVVAPTGGQNSDSLTGREVEVLRLLAAGKSNPEIAQALVISPNTVLRHVNNIFNKINVANRVEAATYALRHGLI